MARHATALMLAAILSLLKVRPRADLFPVENNDADDVEGPRDRSLQMGITQSQSKVAYFVFFSISNDS